MIFRSQSPSDNEGQLYREEDVLGRVDSITVEDIPDEGDKFILNLIGNLQRFMNRRVTT